MTLVEIVLYTSVFSYVLELLFIYFLILEFFRISIIIYTKGLIVWVLENPLCE